MAFTLNINPGDKHRWLKKKYPAIAKDLYEDEIRRSEDASEDLGWDVALFKDGVWICQPIGKGGRWKNGYGTTPEKAIEDCRRENA
jgi:hypothetical protein